MLQVLALWELPSWLLVGMPCKSVLVLTPVHLPCYQCTVPNTLLIRLPLIDGTAFVQVLVGSMDFLLSLHDKRPNLLGAPLYHPSAAGYRNSRGKKVCKHEPNLRWILGAST